jgi:tetratricopeptide (TPR) repeat protein
MVSLWNRPGLSFSRINMARLSAAKARVSQRTVYEQRSIWQRIATSWQLIGVIWNVGGKFVLQLAGLLAFALIGVLLWKALTQKTIAIAPIAVPKMLAENGYTADVAAQRLRDALNNVVAEARTRKEGPGVVLHADLLSIVVPAIGLSLETIAAEIRTFFRIKGRWNISGEFTIAEKRLWLRLRMNGIDFFTSPNGVDPERPDDLLVPAAEKVYELADPYIAAASLRDHDPGKSLEIARRIIADRPETDPIVPWAHNLIGNRLWDLHKTEEAIAEYRKAIELDPREAMHHNNLGLILSDQHKTRETREAIAEYRKAIELDPRRSEPHQYLADILSTQGYAEEAIAELRKAIELDPRNAGIHIILGAELNDQHKTEEAVVECRNAIELDPRDAAPHGLLGDALRAQGKTDEAIAEYRKVIELDPSLALPHKYLAIILREQGKTKEADAEDQKAKELGAKHPD